MAIQSVVAGIDDAALEPSVEGLVRVVQDLVPFLIPVNRFRCFAPEPLRVINRSRKRFLVPSSHGPPLIRRDCKDSQAQTDWSARASGGGVCYKSPAFAKPQRGRRSYAAFPARTSVS